MTRCLSPLLVLTLAPLACAQPADRAPTPDEVRMADRLAVNWELEDTRTLEHQQVDGPHGTFEAFRGEFPADDIVIEWIRFESREAALASLDLFRAAPNAVKVAAVYGKQIYTIEVRDAELSDRYALSGGDAAEAIRLLRNDEHEDGTGWLRVKSPEGAFGYVPGADVEIDTFSVEVESPFLVIRQAPNAQGKALSVVNHGEHLERAFLTDRQAPDTVIVTAGNERGSSFWSTAVLTTSKPLQDRTHGRLEEALGPRTDANRLLTRSEGGRHLILADTNAPKQLLDYLAAFAKDYGPSMDEAIAPVKTLRAKPVTAAAPGSRGGIVSGLGGD